MQSPSQPQPPFTTTAKDKTTTALCSILGVSLFSLLFILSLSSSSSSHHSPAPPLDPYLFPSKQTQTTNHFRLLVRNNPNSTDPSPPLPPTIAYLISGSNSTQILRLLHAVYHPRNYYLLHLDLSSPQSERASLALAVRCIDVFRAARNVNVIGKADYAYQKGSSALSSTLRGASIMLRIYGNWDWFINLSAAHYPLVTQDDLLHILSYMPRELNFVTHTSYIGWRESRKLKPIIVDPGLYLSEKTAMFYATQQRELPDAFRLFMSSSSGILSRDLIEFCIFGTDNLPRTLLMYLSNTPSSASVYFPTLICNSRQFNRTIVNHGLHYSSLNNKKEPRSLNSTDFGDLIRSGAAFASPFLVDDPVLDHIDKQVLGRSHGQPVPGGWCLGESDSACDVWGDADILRPGPGARRLEKVIVKLLRKGLYGSPQCVAE